MVIAFSSGAVDHSVVELMFCGALNRLLARVLARSCACVGGPGVMMAYKRRADSPLG